MKKQVGRWPDGWFDGNVITPTYVYKSVEVGEHKYKVLPNGNVVLKVKRDGNPSVFYIWDSSDDFYRDVKDQYPELKNKPL